LGNALGRFLAEDVVASEDYPRYPMAAMDGYAVLHADLAAGKISICGEAPAGGSDVVAVEPGVCVKTFTGAVMPAGADTLIPIENVTVEGETILIDTVVPKGFSVRPVGESYRRGNVLLKKGTKLGFAEIGVLAGLGRTMVGVVRKPRVAILATGSEILDLGECPEHPGQIRSSNNYTLQALIEAAGGEAVQLGTCRDDRASITAGFENALASADIVLSTGGVSVGDYDFVKEIIPRLGAEVIYKGVNIKPGQHVMVARRGEQFLLGLPGFAYSSTVTAVLYALPLLYKMLGTANRLKVVEATLKEPFAKKSKKSEFTACNLRFADGRYLVDFEGKKEGSSAILTNLLGPQSALMLTGEEDRELESGMAVHVLMLDQF